ncbi:aspartokinase [Morchella conica CCBAS932]|uniref:Aspartokinase n=1 Tax=Morchella conica CCBAS932 TaxID=1392247 RepID=A0A3N4L379_9PEZI|nr:aspartokinase [Morchella conica CCBAS932]
MGWVVHRFDSLCIGKFGAGIVEDIIKPGVLNNRQVVVCSAMQMGGGADRNMTRQLKSAVEASLTHQSEEYLALFETIEEDHIRMASELINSAERLEHLKEEIIDECNLVTRLIGASQILGQMNPRAKDIILGVRDRLSCILMTSILQDRGIYCEYINPEGIVNSSYPGKNVLDQKLCDFVSEELTKQVQECERKTIVVTGYFGNMQGVTAGRDYGDLTAATLAVGLGANELKIWKEVDGIFTADPKICSTAQLIPVVTSDEAAEMLQYGIQMIHPFAMELVAKANIPINFRNIHNPKGNGTVVSDDVAASFGNKLQKILPKAPTAITIKTGIAVLSINSKKRHISCGFFATVFSTLNKHGLMVDLISTSETHVSVALGSKFTEERLREAIKELKQHGNVELTRHLAIVSLIGRQMKRLVGVASCMFSTLAKEGVNVEMISQGASEINISCVIKLEDAVRAMSVLHTKLFLHKMDFGPSASQKCAINYDS